jgi:ATP-dependent DNA helicase RecG
MANASGGTVLIGVAPRSVQIIGVEDPQEVIDRVFQAALLSDPPLVLPVPVLVSAQDVTLVSVTVPAGLPHLYNLDGRYLIREGTQTNPIPPRRLRQLLVERGVIQTESLLPPLAFMDDFDPEKVSAYVQALGYPPGEDALQVLLRRGCLRREAKGSDLATLRPTYAGLLLFGRHPQHWLPSATILAARFQGISFSDQFIKQEISGTLTDQLKQAEIFVRENLRTVVNMTGMVRQERLEYPFVAVRELLVNAVAHRDYNLQGDSIHLNIFADRLEVHSPGGLPGPVNLENLLEARFSRNAVIVQVLSDFGYVEKLGYGLDRVVTAMREYSLPAPRFEEIAGTFRVTLFGERRQYRRKPVYNPGKPEEPGLNFRQEILMDFLAEHSRITNREYQELCPDVHAETLRRDLADLVSRGLLIKIGDKRATYYILKYG